MMPTQQRNVDRAPLIGPPVVRLGPRSPSSTDGREVAKRLMRPVGVVLLTPVIDQDLGLQHGVQQLGIEELRIGGPLALLRGELPMRPTGCANTLATHGLGNRCAPLPGEFGPGSTETRTIRTGAAGIGMPVTCGNVAATR